MDTELNLCMGCMNELDADGHCHYCNYSEDIPFLQSYLAPKTVLDDRYIIGKMLSYNGEGASYICYDTVAKSKCVCREYYPDTLCERDSKTQRIVVRPDCLAKYKTFMSEFVDMNKVLSKMRNLQHISTALDMFCDNNTTYVILEYVEGVSLKKFLQTNQGFLSWEQVKGLFMPLFTTLSIIHNAGIIHRGISPENIIVGSDAQLKLTGFCISSIRTSGTGLSSEFYSGYTAPEQYSSLDWQGTWTDVYALAAVLYRILTGCMPLDAHTRLHNDTMVDAYRINPNVPMQVSGVLSQAMRVRGEERIQTVNEFVTALFEQHSQRIEHSKGSTQTIPIQHIPKKRLEDAKPQKEKKSKAPTIVAWILLAVVIVAAAFFLFELFSQPSAEDAATSPSSAAVVDDTSEDSSESYVYTTTTTTAASAAAGDLSSQSPYGTGSEMPNVVGHDYDTIANKLGNDFTIIKKVFYDDKGVKGEITKQSIPAGSDYDPAKKNELVLTVCAGPQNVQIPDYSGLTKKSYLVLLDSLNIKYTVLTDYSNNVAAGYVIGTNINVGDTINVSSGEVLTVTVSAGIVTVPQSTATTVAPESPTDTTTTAAQ